MQFWETGGRGQRCPDKQAKEEENDTFGVFPAVPRVGFSHHFYIV